MKRTIIAALAMLFLTSPIASAHHSFGMFDRNEQVKLTGVVQQFNWTNPHSSLIIKTADGKTWWLELTTPGQLIRTGWKRTALKAGDRVNVIVHPLRNGSPGGSLMVVTTVTGANYYDGGGPAAGVPQTAGIPGDVQ
jgi:hypothetical protein